MRLDSQPIQLPPGEFASYPSQGQRPYDVFEIYNDTDGTHTAALISWITFQSYVPSASLA